MEEVLALMIPIIAILGVVFLVALKILKGGPGSATGYGADEAQLMQDVYRGLQEMERRIEALETILLDRERARKEAGK